MKLLTIATILAVVQTGAFFSSRAEVPPGAETIRSGRAIQLDGFLIDWQETMRKPWAGSSLWFRDAAATPEGLAGYAISRSPSCSTWTIFFVAREPSQPPLSMKIPAADTATGSYCVRHERLNGIATLTIEWLVPWDSITVNAWGDYAVRLWGLSSCGDSLATIAMAGTIKPRSGKDSLQKMLALRFVLLAIMLGFFIGLQFMVRKRPRRRGSWRRD